MSSTSSVSFPAPIGGVPLERDFAPSIVFAVLYAILVAIAIYRFARTKSRTLVVIGTFAFVVERVVIWSLRAKQAKTPSEELDRNLTIYWQTTFAAGYVSIYSGTTALLRCLLVRTTQGAPVGGQVPLTGDSQSLASPRTPSLEERDTIVVGEDAPRLRFWYRRMFGVLALSSWVPIILSIIMGYNYVEAETSASKAQYVQTLRYVVTAFALAFVLILQGIAIFALLCVRRVQRTGVTLSIVVCTLLNIVSIYHFVIMRNWTDALISTAPGSQNAIGEKAAFYVLQALPEAIAAALLLVPDVREHFSTGLRGDRLTDPKAKV